MRGCGDLVNGVRLLDRDVPPGSTLTFAGELRTAGRDVELRVYADEDHSGTVRCVGGRLDPVSEADVRPAPAVTPVG